MQSHPAAGALLRAANWLEEHDWCQGDYGPNDWQPGDPRTPTACCLLGAIAVANDFQLGDPGYVQTAQLFVETYDREAIPDDAGVPYTLDEMWDIVCAYMSQFNDAPGMKKQLVIHVLRSVAVRALHEAIPK